MTSTRGIVFCIGLLINFVAFVLLAFSTAGFSLSESAVRSAYWAYAKQPDWTTTKAVTRFGDDYTLTTTNTDGGTVSDFSIELFYGLRMYLVDCEGSQCESSSWSYRWQNCDYDDDYGPFKDSTICSDCRFGGQAAGSYACWSLFLLLPAAIISFLRIDEFNDNIAIKIAGLSLHLIILLFELVGIVLYIVFCFNKLGEDYYESDDIVDGADVAVEMGPALVVNIVVLLLQPLLLIFHASFSHAPSDSSSEGADAIVAAEGNVDGDIYDDIGSGIDSSDGRINSNNNRSISRSNSKRKSRPSYNSDGSIRFSSSSTSTRI